MDIDIVSFASPGNRARLRMELDRLGHRPIDPGDADAATAGGSNRLRLLHLESRRRTDPAVEDAVALTRRPFHMLLTDGPDLIADPLLSEHVLDFCLWPGSDTEFELRLNRAAAVAGDTAAPAAGNGALADVGLAVNMIGSSPAFLSVLYRVKRLARSNASVLITGETGTGKELGARALHYLSPRGSHAFQAVNCGALPEHLIENELFGHVSGAYTDARNAQRGVIEGAHGGTLFLDEVDALPAKGQAALLRFLDNRRYRPLGASTSRNADVRIVAASNEDLEASVAQGRFRRDLMYRLNTLSIHLPALRERDEDVLSLAQHFLRQCELEYGDGGKVFHPCCLRQIAAYPWPGNVRELESFVHHAYLMSNGPVISLAPSAGDSAGECTPPTDEHLTELSPYAQAKRRAIEQFERDYLTCLLNLTQGNVSHAARLACTERRTLGKLIKKLGIDRSRFARAR